MPTRSAYQLVESPLRYKPIALNAVTHTLAVAQTGLQLESLGYHVVTDREINHLVAQWRNNGGGPVPRHMPWIVSTQARSSSASGFTASTPLIHMPDLVVGEPGGMRHAYEVELSMKNTSRARTILDSYAQSGTFSSVNYYLAPGSAETRFRSLVATIPPGARPMSLSMHTFVRQY